MLIFDRWQITTLDKGLESLARLWVELQQFPTLFSDSTKGDIKNWISLIQDDECEWYEVWEGEVLVGVIYFRLEVDDADLHIAFFDRKPAEKKGLVRFFCKFMFDALPRLARISCAVPAMYYGTCRIALAIGKWEGTRRQAVSIGGKRVDVHLYGLLRQEAEAYGIPERAYQRDQHHPERYTGTARESSVAVPTRAER